MFERDEYVFHESGGVCKIADIQAAPLENMPADRLYYILKPVHDPNSVIYIPADSEQIFLRRLMKREEAEELLDRIPFVRTIEESNAKLLRAKYIELMKLHDPVEWVRVIKTVYVRVQMQPNSGRRVSDSERAFAETAKRHLHTELSLALELPFAKMEAHIADRIQKAE